MSREAFGDPPESQEPHDLCPVCGNDWHAEDCVFGKEVARRLKAERDAHRLAFENDQLRREAERLHDRLQACIDDPMWADHAEVPKTLLRQTLEELALVRAAMGVAYGYLWLVNNEPGTPYQYPPEKAAYQARKALRDKLTQAERGHFINAAIAAVRPLTDHDRALTGAKLTDTSGTDC